MLCTSVNILVGMRSGHTLHSWLQHEHKQISPICWERLVEHLCSWNTGTVKCVCLYLYSAHTSLNPERECWWGPGSQPWTVGQPQPELAWPLGKPVFSLYEAAKEITDAFCKASNWGEQEIQNSWKKQIRHQLVFDQTTEVSWEIILPNSIYGEAESKKSNGWFGEGESSQRFRSWVPRC